MLDSKLRTSGLPVIPDKRYFTISEVAALCRVKNHVLRYWEQEFSKLHPVRRGNRRYYRHTDVILIRKIRCLLYDQQFTIDGARAQLNSRKPSLSYEKNNTARNKPKSSKSLDTKYYQQALYQTIVDLKELLEEMRV